METIFKFSCVKMLLLTSPDIAVVDFGTARIYCMHPLKSSICAPSQSKIIGGSSPDQPRIVPGAIEIGNKVLKTVRKCIVKSGASRGKLPVLPTKHTKPLSMKFCRRKL